MANTRSSGRSQGSNSSTPQKNSPSGQKRKEAPSASPQAKRSQKQQKTLDETAPDDSEMKAAADEVEEKRDSEQKAEADDEAGGKEEEASAGAAEQKDEPQANGDHEMKEAETAEKQDDVKGDQKHDEGAVERSEERGEKFPSTITEKGIFYFLARGRVGVDRPESVADFARSYLVLRPLPKDAKLKDGVLEDLGNNRLLALPKKVMPKSHRDTFMTFVEKAGTSIQDLKDNFMKGSEYDTKTTGTQHSPPVTPLIEGVYAITETGRTSHFAYIVTIPSELGEVQRDMGFDSKGSFVCSVKNPEHAGPANAQLPQGPGFSKEILEDFHGLRWKGLQPRHLEYPNAQFLLIGEAGGELGKAVEASAADEKHDKETPEEEIQWLEDEDSHRTGQLSGEDTIFEDLGASQKEFPGIKSTW